MGRKGKNRRRQQKEISPTEEVFCPDEAPQEATTAIAEAEPRCSKIPVLSAKARLAPIVPVNTTGSRIPRLSALINTIAHENRHKAVNKGHDIGSPIPDTETAQQVPVPVRGQA